MESWRITWRAFVKALPEVCRETGTEGATGEECARAALTCLRDGLLADNPTITQGSTTTPPPLMCVQDWPVEAADAIGWLGLWSGTLALKATDGKGQSCASVGSVEEFFARMCFEADRILGEPAGCRWFLNWFDDTPRDEMRAYLIPEVEFALDPKCGDPSLHGGARAKLTPTVTKTPTPF